MAGKMWEQVVLVILFALSNCIQGGEIFDVTTIYNVTEHCGLGCSSVSQGYIHARTNALGLPLFDGKDKYIVSKDSQQFNITCDPSEGVCSWDTKDWLTYVETNQIIKAGEPYRRYRKLRLKFKHSITGKHYLYFVPMTKQRELPFVIEFEKRTEETYDYYNYRYTDVEYTKVYKGCTIKTEYDSSYISILINNEKKYFGSCQHSKSITFSHGSGILTFLINDGEFKIYTGQEGTNLVYHEPISRIADVKYFSMDGDSLNSFKPSIETPALSAVKEGSEIYSPMFYPNSSQLCLTLVIDCQKDTKEDLLHILATDLLNYKHKVSSISDVQAGLNIKNFKVNLPSNLTSPIKLAIRKVGAETVNINRISSCNLEGEEVEYVSTTEDVINNRLSIPIFTTDTSNIELSKNEDNSTKEECFNGGVWTSEGCSCPPGFSGHQCLSACGQNHYGQDCGGLCSLHPQECKGLLMCTEATKCHCATGFSGLHCTEECSPGWYGNDCSQPCGQCASGNPCDKYTGECDECETGYKPPYCKKVSLYYASKPGLSSPGYSRITVTFDPNNYITTDDGTPELYQIQYKEKFGQWYSYITKSINGTYGSEKGNKIISETIENLKPGMLYKVRVLLIDGDFNKYDGNLVPESEILATCEIPDKYDYNLTSSSNSSAFKFYWQYVNDSEHWCLLEFFEVSWKEDWKWLTTKIYHSNFGSVVYDLPNFLPRSTIKFRVRAKTTGGFAPYSKTIEKSTSYIGTSKVRHLKVAFIRNTAVGISWDAPKDSNGSHLQYKITYKCVEQPACSPGCYNAAEGQLTTAETSITLNPLLPFARYKVTVTPDNGHQAVIYFGTPKTVPTEVPRPSVKGAIRTRTNTSLTVSWDEVPVCTSFMLGYNYQLVKASENLKVLASGLTKDTSMSFHNLTVSTDYLVKVFIVTVAGWNPESVLAINVSTSATVPEAVRNLTVYKRGRNLLSLRWLAPSAIYGKLKSFTVTHTLGHDVVTRTLEPTHCIVWPDFYCYTIEGLKSNRRYNISVSARNTELPEDGMSVYITGITKESPPSAPEALKVINTTSTSIGLRWQYPDMANGIVRTYLVSVEETEMYDQDSCCQVYPLLEISVAEEAQTCETEVSPLHPAATYFVSVSAKTVGMGPSQSLVINTRPPHLPFTVLPELEITSNEEFSWQPQEELTEMSDSHVYSPLIKTQLLLAVINETQPLPEVSSSGISNKQLNGLLEQMIAKPFYFVAEYNEGDTVTLNANENESEWGEPSTLTRGQQYQLIAVQVTEYNGVYNADLRYSTNFTLLF